MKKTNLIFALIFSIVSFLSFGQTEKIHFIYHMKSHLYIDESGIYADTVYLKDSFKKNSYKLSLHPKDSTKTVGFIDIKSLSEKDRKKVIGIFSHSNFKYDCYYNIKKNKTTMYVTRIENDETHDMLKKLFNETYSKIYYNRVYINYNKNQKFSTNAPFGTLTLYNPNNILVHWFDENKIGGEFNYPAGDIIFKDLLIADPTLDKHITPYYTFANCDYGIKKIVSVSDSTDLVSVTY